MKKEREIFVKFLCSNYVVYFRDSYGSFIFLQLFLSMPITPICGDDENRTRMAIADQGIFLPHYVTIANTQSVFKLMTLELIVDFQQIVFLVLL